MAAKKSQGWKPLVLLEQFGVFKVIGEVESHPTLGKRVKVRCQVCKSDDIQPLAKLREAKRRGARPRCPSCGSSTVKSRAATSRVS